MIERKLMLLNRDFISNIGDVYGETGVSWLKELPASLAHLSSKWNFRFLRPFPRLSYSFVGLVEIPSNAKTAVIKMTPDIERVVIETRWLSCFPQSVPEIYEQDEKHSAFLMEHLEPGMTLKSIVEQGDDDAATRILCQTIRGLQSQQHPEFQFRHLSELAKDLLHLKGRFDPGLLSQAESWFRELTSDRTQDVVLHGDLHHDNILSSSTGWKIIDPHGYAGDPAAEVGVLIRNPFDSFPKDRPLSKVIERRLRILKEELPFDAQKIKAWAFCMTVLSAAWTVEGHGRVTELEAQVASAIDQTQI